MSEASVRGLNGCVGNLGLGQPSSLEEHSAKSWYRQRSHNQHGRKDELCSRYPALNLNACTLEKLKERWRKDWVRKQEQSKGMTQRMHEIAVHTWKTQRKVDWEAATVKQVETNYTQRRTVEAIHIRKQEATSNLDCGQHLSPVWQPLIRPPQGHNHP